jgi:hypothetical protein
MLIGVGMIALLALSSMGVCKPPDRDNAADALVMRLRLRVHARTADGAPAAGYEIRFLDTAPPPTERGSGVSIGSTDAQGRFAGSFVHSWPDYFRPDRRPDAGTFDIIVGLTVFHSSVECLPTEQGERILTLDVTIEPEQIIITQNGRPVESRGRPTRG